MSATTPDIEALAAELGKDVYIDVANWHLFLAEAHLHIPLAERVYPLLEGDRLTRQAVEEILQQLTVVIGGGKVQISLGEAIPTTGVNRLMDLLEEYQRENF